MVTNSARSTKRSLVVMGPSGMFTVALPENGELVVGRSEECDVCVDDPKLSRKHLAVRVAAKMSVVDLGSTNGTFVRNQRLTADKPADIAEDETVSFGSTVLIVRAYAGPTSRRVWDHAYFEARLEEACSTANVIGGYFSVVRIRFDSEALAAQSREIVLEWLEPADVIAVASPQEFEVFMLPVDAQHMTTRLTDIGRALANARARVRAARFPEHGRTPTALLAYASGFTDKRAPAATVRSQIVQTGAIAKLDPIIRRVAAGHINVLLLGETGVGKEVLARTLHERSLRAQAPLLTINCAAVAEGVMESELFGHEKGAFTGAGQAKVGLLESAEGGTVFLDEVGEMPLSLQAKLLRVIEQREVVPVGAVKPRKIDVRFIAATNRNLETEIAAGRFRGDLYFRLNGMAITLPPLRERIDEIEPLARVFVAEASKQAMRHEVLSIAPEAIALLLNYSWPGNIRELRNVIERAVVLCSGGTIGLAHLPLETMTAPSTRPTIPSAPPKLIPPEPAPEASEAPKLREAPAADPAVDAERARIIAALEKCGGNQSKAAQMLGIARRTLINRIERYNLPRPRKDDDTDVG